jgi:hypothetical protein
MMTHPVLSPAPALPAQGGELGMLVRACASVSVLLLCASLAAATGGREASTVPSDLPEGNGIAANHPADQGIEKDPAVVFADGFEDCSSPADLRARWDWLIHDGNMRIAQEPDSVHAGKRALELTVPQQSAPLAIAVDKQLGEERDVLFLRWYSKFDKDFAVGRSSVHNGGSISSRYFPGGQATPGIRADGRNKFLANYENENSTGSSPGALNIYCYHPEQGGSFGDHFYPSGRVIPGSEVRSGAATFGPSFVARPEVFPESGRWYCYEFMVKANTPGLHDGRIACWLDGKLVSDFPNLRFRSVEDLKPNHVIIVAHSSSVRPNQTWWYDDIVAATSYIGPQAPVGSK